MGDDSEDEWYVDGYKVKHGSDLDDEFADARQMEERWACSAVVMQSGEVEVVGKPAVVFGPGGALGVRVLKGGRNEPIDAFCDAAWFCEYAQTSTLRMCLRLLHQQQLRRAAQGRRKVNL